MRKVRQLASEQIIQSLTGLDSLFTASRSALRGIRPIREFRPTNVALHCPAQARGAKGAGGSRYARGSHRAAAARTSTTRARHRREVLLALSGNLQISPSGYAPLL